MASAPQLYRQDTRIFRYDPDKKTSTQLVGAELNAALAGANYDLNRIQAGAPSAAAAPTGNPIVDSGVRRHVTPATSGTYRTETNAAMMGLDTTAPTEEEAAAIRERTLKEVQGQLDVIDASTATQLADEARRAEERLGRTRAMSARGGRLGSDFGERERQGTEQLNKQGRETIIRAQEAKKAEILANVAKRSTDKIDAEKNAALANIDKKLQYQKELQTAAREDIKTLGLSGITPDQLSDSEYKSLLDQSGYTPIVFDAVYNANLPGGSQRDYTYLNLGNGKVARVDKAGGEPKMFDYSVPEGFTFKMAGDIPVFVNEKTQEVKVAAPDGDSSAFQKETELDSFTDASGNRVTVMYNPTTKTTRRMVTGKVGDAPGSFKPQAIETSAVKQYLVDQGASRGWDKAQTDKAISDAMADQSVFYGFLNDILNDKDKASRYYKPTTIGVPVGL